MLSETCNRMSGQRDSPGEVSAARQALRDSYTNLQSVADYCEKNYMEASDKRQALQGTMSLLTQTVASVACQVMAAAQEVVSLFEEQSQVLHHQQSRVILITQLDNLIWQVVIKMYSPVLRFLSLVME
ncbi:abl interactor 1-like [Discoglossus pictus]